MPALGIRILIANSSTRWRRIFKEPTKFAGISTRLRLIRTFRMSPLLATSISLDNIFNPLPHGVLATFFPTAGGPMGPPIKDDISRENMILMTSLRTHRASAVSSPGIAYTHLPLPPCAIERSLCTLRGQITS
jgi:hypothetical protein